MGAKMTEAEKTEEDIDQGRREALMRLAKYTAPAMLAVLVSVSESRATGKPVIVVSGMGKPPA
jgi:hypothetical protein